MEWTLQELENRSRKVISEKLGTECWLWSPTNKHGYSRIRYDGKSWYLHHLVMFFKFGESDLCNLHKCENRNCINPDHLYRGTQAQNMQDALKDGTHSNLTRWGYGKPGRYQQPIKR